MLILFSGIVAVMIICMVAMHLSHKKEVKMFERWRKDDTRYIDMLQNRIELLEYRNEKLRLRVKELENNEVKDGVQM